MAQSRGLKPAPGLRALVRLGLGYMTPTLLSHTLGIGTKQTHGVVPLAYPVPLAGLFSTAPFCHSGIGLSAVLTGATVVCFSFIGFDAISMYAEEARKTSDVAKAIIICLLIGGGIFLAAGHVAQSVFPSVAGFHLTDDTLPEMALRVGGKFFQVLFMAAAFAATVASAL